MVEEYVATGRRKRAVASVRLRPGQGNIDVNKRGFEDYFTTEIQREAILAPFKEIGGNGSYDLVVRVNGGGVHGQATAVRLGIARAIVQSREDLRQNMKDKGFLTRDPRKKERKKYGLAGARKRFQFSKR